MHTHDQWVGSTLVGGRYRLLDTLGEGGMARVWSAEDTRLERIVALKMLHPPYQTEPRVVRRFAHEAQLAARLVHPHIVTIYDVGCDGERPYLVMEYVAGGSLQRLLAGAAPLALEQSVVLLRQLGDALDAAHAKGIIHRDVKPQNILLTPSGDVKVTDFGIARALNGAEQTTTELVLGSVCYIAPEQAQGQPATAAADLYSSGVVLYELLTGRRPFVAETALALALQHVAQPPIPPSALVPSLPAEVDAVVLRALHKDPAQRYASGAALAAALATALAPSVASRMAEAAAPLHRAPTLQMPRPMLRRPTHTTRPTPRIPPARRPIALLALLLLLAGATADAATTALVLDTPVAGRAHVAATLGIPSAALARRPQLHRARRLRSHRRGDSRSVRPQGAGHPDRPGQARLVSRAHGAQGAGRPHGARARPAQPAQPPTNPTTMHVTSGSCAVHQIVWTWSAAPRATAYDVVLYDPQTGAMIRSTQTRHTAYALGAGPGATVALKVRSRNAAGTASSFFTPGRVPAVAPNPTGLSASSTGHTILWSWTAEPHASAYDVVLYHYRGHRASADITGRTTLAHWRLRVTPGVTYYLKVRTVGPCAPTQYYTPATSATAGT